MLSPVPAFVGGVPGGLELAIIFFIAFLLFGVPLALAVLLGYRYVTGQRRVAETDQRVDELESELETLREQVAGSTEDASSETSSTADDDSRPPEGSDE